MNASNFWKNEANKLLNKVVDNSKITTGGGYKDYTEEYFMSFSPDTTSKRYYQALKYGKNEKEEEAYGMECNCVTLMYFLQSLGLFPPEMTRKEFEYAFTTLLPYADKESIKKTKSITIDSIEPQKFILEDDILIAKPLNLKPNNLIDPYLLSQNTLLGGSFGISLVRQVLSTAINKLEKITKAFASFPYDTKQKGKYDFMKDYHRSIVKENIINKNNFVEDLSSKLSSGSLDSDYFETGKTIFTSVCYAASYDTDKGYSGATGHYSLVVNKYIDSFVSNGVSYYIYPIDDSLWGGQYILFPSFKGLTNSLKQDKINGSSYDGVAMHSFAGLAIGLK